MGDMIEARYIELSDQIEKGIKSGLWKIRLPGVIKLSKELKADPATISKAFKLLSDRGLVTIQGTKGTYITQPGQKTRHKIIGVVGIRTDMPSRHGELFPMEEAAAACGYRIVGVAHSNTLFIDNMELLLQFPVDGYIFMYSSLTFNIAAFLREKGIPFVSCNKPVGIPGVNWVDFNSEATLAKAVRYLIGLGHRRIAYAEFHNPNYSYTERMLSTYRQTLTEAGLHFNESFFLSKDVESYYNKYGEEYCFALGRDCALELIEIDDKPTAIIMTFPQMGDGLVEELGKHSLSVPNDFSVLVYGDQHLKNEFFTSVNYDYTARSAAAVKMLIDLLDSPWQEARQKLIEGEIAVARSCTKNHLEK